MTPPGPTGAKGGSAGKRTAASSEAGSNRSKRLRPRVLGGWSLIVLLLVIVSVLGFLWLRSSDVFALEELALPQPHRVGPEEVRQALAPYAEESVLSLPLEEMQARLEAIPYVRSATLHPGLPHSLRVDIEEHEPWARVRAKEGDWLVATDGTVLEPAGAGGSAPEDVLTPVLVPAQPAKLEPGRPVGDQVLGSFEALEALESVWPKDYPVKKVTLRADGDLSVWLDSGTELKLGEPRDLEPKLMVALEILKVYSRDGEMPAYIDVQLPSRPVAKPR